MNANAIGKVVQVAGPAVSCQFPEGQIPLVYTAIRITSEGFDVPTPIDIICEVEQHIGEGRVRTIALQPTDRKSTRLNSSHLGISYAVFCLKKKKTQQHQHSHLLSSSTMNACTSH